MNEKFIQIILYNNEQNIVLVYFIEQHLKGIRGPTLIIYLYVTVYFGAMSWYPISLHRAQLTE